MDLQIFGGRGASSGLSRKIDKLVRDMAAKGYIDMSVGGLTKKMSAAEALKFYELVDKYYSIPKGFSIKREIRHEKSLFGSSYITKESFQVQMRLPNKKKYKGTFETIPLYLETESQKNGHFKVAVLQYLGQVFDGGVRIKPNGFYNNRENYDEAKKLGWEIPEGVRLYWEAK